MKVSSLILLRPVRFFMILALAVVVLPSLVLPIWYKTVKSIEHQVDLSALHFQSLLLSKIHYIPKLYFPMNTSALNLARHLSWSLKGTNFSFIDIEKWVCPSMYEALVIIPQLVQISYIGLNGVFFSYYYTNHTQTMAVYSNSSIAATRNKYTWYTQSVNTETGKLHGDAVIYPPSINIFNESWFQQAINSKHGYSSSLGTGWNNASNLLFLNTANIDGRGVISLGFPVNKTLSDYFSGIDFHGALLTMATKDGKVVAEWLPIRNTSMLGNLVSCRSGDNNAILDIWEKKYRLYCSPLEIMGVQWVYVIAFPYKGRESVVVHKKTKVGLILLILMLVIMAISIFSFILMILRTAKREMKLCAKLIKQMEATQHSERKCMNKCLAFASASHDVRASLAGITGLIEISYDQVSPGSDFHTNLKQMESCTKDLLALLNSILDTSKIEAGKMQLDEEDFNLAQLVEDVVDLYHPVGMKKGVDVVLDLCDASVIKFSNVKGDRGKLKQILCNLLSNAVKFTSEGHVTVRTWAKKPSLETSILPSKRRGLMNHFAGLCYKNHEPHNDVVVVNQNSMEFVFEVDDTGKGIPKEKHTSVFENFVQVKDTALGQAGTGLGLGIVQSLVLLMGGEIGIVDKGIGEKGACFRFNCFLEIVSMETTEQIPTPSPKLEGSVVALLIQNDERRRISHKFMESLRVKVLVLDNWEHLSSTLNKMKCKLDSNNTSSLSDSSSRIDQMKDFAVGSMVPSSFILVVIEASAGPYLQMLETVATFRRDLHHSLCCKIVWLEKPNMRNNHLRKTDEEEDDLIISKPFHGTRLMQVMRLLPEFGASMPTSVVDPSSSNARNVEGNSEVDHPWKKIMNSEIHEHGNPSIEKPLLGKKVLVAEDTSLLRMLATANLTQLGATVVLCKNGREALDMVCKRLRDGKEDGAPVILPFDYILMDCEMPVMNGYEATKLIREEEKQYHIHIPIIALTAHTEGEETRKTLQAGMDAHLGKPLRKQNLLEAIGRIHKL